MAAAEIVARISGKPFIQYVHDNIFSKLPFSPWAGYHDSTTLQSSHLAEGFVAVERNSTSKSAEGWSKSVWKTTPFFVEALDLDDIVAGPGGVVLSANDAVRLLLP